MTEFSGRTIAEAIEIGLASLGLNESEAEIETLDEGRGGVFGLGSRPARVRIIRRGESGAPGPSQAAFAPPAEDDPALPSAPEAEMPVAAPVAEPVAASVAVPVAPPLPEPNVTLPVSEHSETEEKILTLSKKLLSELLLHMELRAEVEGVFVPPAGPGDDPVYSLNIEGEDLGILIGRRGETMDALQYLVRLMVNRETRGWHEIEVDVEHYKQRREKSLKRLAETMADRAVSSKRTMVLEAMPPRERRLIHLALRNRKDVETHSIGEGENRKVTIIPV